MKKFYISAAFFAVVALGSTVPAIAQKSKVIGDEAVAAAGLAERKLDNVAFRVVLTTEWFAERDGEAFNRSVETFTAVQPDRFQSISEVNGTRIETIVVEGRTFRRTNDDEWESVATPPIKRAGSQSTTLRFGAFEGGAVFPAGNGKFVARGTIDGQEVTQYETRKVLADSTPGGSARVETSQVWINNDGLIVRKVTEQQTTGEPRFMRSVALYMYDNIKVEEPILPVREN